MVSLGETQQILRQRSQQIAEAQSQVESFNPSLEAMRTQKFLRTAPQGSNVMTQQVRLKEAERQRGIAKEQAQQEIQKLQQEQAQAEAELNSYLSSDEGKLQLAKESGMKPTRYESMGVYGGGTVEVPVYETPYGTVKDMSPYYARKESVANVEAKELGYKDYSELQKAIELSSGNMLTSPTGAEINPRTGMITITETVEPSVSEVSSQVNYLLTNDKGFSFSEYAANQGRPKPNVDFLPGAIKTNIQLSSNIKADPNAGKYEFIPTLVTAFKPTKVVNDMGNITLKDYMQNTTSNVYNEPKYDFVLNLNEALGKDVSTYLKGQRYEGINYYKPEYNVPQRSTLLNYGSSSAKGQFTIPSANLKLLPPEDIGAVVTTLPYLVPYVGSGLMISGAVRGVEKISKGNIQEGAFELGSNLLFLTTAKPVEKLFSREFTVYRQATKAPEMFQAIEQKTILGPSKVRVIEESALSGGTSKVTEVFPFTSYGRDIIPGYVTTIESKGVLEKLGVFSPAKVSKSSARTLIESGETTLGKLSNYKIDKILSGKRAFVQDTLGKGTISLTYGGELKAPKLSSDFQVNRLRTNLNLQTKNYGNLIFEGIKPSKLATEVYVGKQPAKYLGEFPKGKLQGIEFYKSYPSYQKFYLGKGENIFGKYDVLKDIYTYPKGARSRLSQIGRTKSTVEQLSGLKNVGEGMSSIGYIGDEVLQYGKINVPVTKYKEISLSKSIIPKGKLSKSSSELLVLKSEKMPIEITIPSPIKYKNIDVSTKPLGKGTTFTTEQAKDITKTLKELYGLKVAQRLEEVKLSLIPKIPTKAVTKSSLKPFKVEPAETSLFYGKGTYEKTEEGLMFKPEAFRTNEITTLKVVQPQRIDIKSEFKIDTRQNTKLDMNQSNRLGNRIIQVPIERADNRFDTRLDTKIDVKLDTRLDTRQTQKQINRIVQKPFSQSYKIPEVKPPRKIKLKSIYGPQDRRNVKKIKAVKKPSKYITELRRYGKFKPIAVSEKPQQALDIGKAAARKTLGASIRVRTDTGFLPVAPSQEFGLSRRAGNVLVQRKTARISSYGEKREIQSLRMKLKPIKLKGGIF